MINKPQLRPYQADGLARVRQSFASGNRRVFFQLPTGGGKTVIMAEATTGAMRKGLRVGVLVHRQELIDQTARTFQAWGLRHAVDYGIIAAGYRESPLCPVQICSVGTLVRRLDDLRPFDFLKVDEAHHAVAETWAKILRHHPSAWVFGVTATPCRLDGKGLSEFADDLVCGPSVSELVDGGYLAQPIVYAPAKRRIAYSEMKTTAGDWNKADAERVMSGRQIVGDAVEHYRRLCAGAPAIAFCVSVKHAETVAEQFRAAGFRSMSVDGSMDRHARREAIEGLAKGRVDVLASCDLISEGLDVPGVVAAILLRPTQSLGLYLQQVGRAMRPAEGKTAAIILDHAENSLVHGLPTEDREWSLHGVPDGRKKAADGGGLAARMCPSCFAVNEVGAATCIACGNPLTTGRSVEEVDGELEEVGTVGAADADPVIEMLRRMTYGECLKWAKTEAELRLVAKARNYRPGWVWNAMKQRERYRNMRAAKSESVKRVAHSHGIDVLTGVD